MHQYYVYIMASRNRALYVGVANDLRRRVAQHRQQRTGFTAKYHITRLVYHERSDDARSAVAREKQIKGWTRAKKLDLIEAVNPGWADLAESWFAEDALR